MGLLSNLKGKISPKQKNNPNQGRRGGLLIQREDKPRESLSPSQRLSKGLRDLKGNLKNSRLAEQLKADWDEARSSPTARRIKALTNLNKDDARTQARAAVQGALKKYLGMDLTDPNRFKRRGKEEREIAEKQIKEGDFGTQNFIVDNAGEIEDYYEVLNSHELGVGGTAFVVRGIERSTKSVRAIKKIHKRDMKDLHRVRQEISVMKSLDHPNIVKLFETFEDTKYLYLVMEICEGGDLLDKLKELKRFSDLQSAILTRIILCTVNYLHVNEIIHRDIKPDNFLFKQQGDDILNSSIRLVDFGYSCKFPKSGLLSTKVGSPYYVSPQVLQGKYDEKCDMWSCGVVIYLMIVGYPPFVGETDAETLNKVRSGEFSFNKRDWKHNEDNKQAKHLIRNLLQVDAEKRYSVEQALKHPWVKNRGINRLEDMKDSTADRLMLYKNHHKLRKAAMLAVAYHLDEEDVADLRMLFQGLDLNGDGLLTREEFIKGVNACGIDEANILQMIQSVDADGSGVIDYTEFLAATLEKKLYSKKHEACFLAFRAFDQDGGGTVDKEEVQATLGVEDDKEMDLIFEEVDLNNDGQMDYKEFHHMLRQEPQREVSIEDEGEMMAGGAADMSGSEEDSSAGGEGSESEEDEDEEANED